MLQLDLRLTCVNYNMLIDGKMDDISTQVTSVTFSNYLFLLLSIKYYYFTGSKILLNDAINITTN